MPSFSEIGGLVGIRSKNAVSKRVARLESRGVLSRNDTGRLIPGSLTRPLKVLETVEAGFPSPAEEESELRRFLSKPYIEIRRELNGRSVYPVTNAPPPPVSRSAKPGHSPLPPAIGSSSSASWRKIWKTPASRPEGTI